MTQIPNIKVFAVMLAAAASFGAANAFTVDADIPAGNILVNSVNGDVVKIRQDFRDGLGPNTDFAVHDDRFVLRDGGEFCPDEVEGDVQGAFDPVEAEFVLVPQVEERHRFRVEVRELFRVHAFEVFFCHGHPSPYIAYCFNRLIF